MSGSEYIKVKEDQSVYDLAIQYYGSVDGVEQLMIDNPGVCNYDNDPVPGTYLLITASTVVNKDAVNKLKVRGISPANSCGLGGFSSGFSYGFNI